MGRAAIGIGWLLWRQNRVGLIGICAFLAVGLAALRLAAGALGPAASIVGAVALGYALLFLAGLGCLNLFSEEQSFRPYLFTLPVRTRSLVLWHMIYPIGAAVVLWLGGAWVLFVPSVGVSILWWPTAIIAALISIWQASLWYPAAWYLRPVFIVLGLTGPALLLGQAWIRDMPIESLSPSLLAAVPVAAFVAVRGVNRARHGQNSKRLPNLAETAIAGAERPKKRPFRSAQAAQLWLEWRTNGIVLPVMTGVLYLIYIPIGTLVVGGLVSGFAVSDLGIGHIQTYSAFRWVPILIPTTALLLVTAGASVLQGTVQRDRSLMPFFAGRPMTSWDLAMAKVRCATVSALATWALTLLVVGLWLLTSATDGHRHGTLGSLLLLHGPPRAALCALAGLVVIMIWSWRAGVCALFLGLSGRIWLGWVAAGLFFVQVGAVLYLRAHPALAREVARLLPDPALALAILKLMLAAFVFWLLRRKNLASGRALAKVAGGWIVAAVALCAVLIWLLPPALAPARGVVAAVVLLIPLVRPSLAPLALAWNRHR